MHARKVGSVKKYGNEIVLFFSIYCAWGRHFGCKYKEKFLDYARGTQNTNGERTGCATNDITLAIDPPGPSFDDGVRPSVRPSVCL